MSGRYSSLDREIALQKLDAWTSARRRRGRIEQAMQELLAPLLVVAGEEGFDEATAHLNFQEFLSRWVYAEAHPGSEPPAAAALLASDKAARLPIGSRRYLQALATSQTGLFDVVAVEPGHRCTLRDRARNGRQVEVFEKRGTQQLVPGQVLGARLAQGGDGRTVFEGVLVFDGEVEGSSAGAQRPAPTSAAEVLQLWMEVHFGQQQTEGLEPLEVNGEVLESGFSVYALTAAAPGADALAQVPGMVDEGGGEWRLYEKVLGGRRLIGDAGIVERGRERILVLEAPGRKSMERLSEAVRKVFGKTMRPRHTEYGPPVMVEPGSTGTLSTHEVAVDPVELGVDPDAPDASEQVMRAVLQRHLEDWMDKPLPALGGMTPRDAARDPGRREDVVRLLRKQERHDRDRAERDGVEPLDFEAARRELGLA